MERDARLDGVNERQHGGGRVSTLNIGRRILTVGAALAITRCAGAHLPVASTWGSTDGASAVGVPTSALHGATALDHGGPLSWMSPDAVTQDLLYVSDIRTVTVYSYPAGKLEGILRHFYIATGMCVDGKGDVFVADTGYGKIFEYAHGGSKRLATLDSPASDPVGCAVDPTTGNLAVGNQGSGSGVVAVFQKARGKPATYDDPSFYQFYFCGYDGKGNLFADGLTGPASGDVGVAELAKGKTELTNLEVSQYITWPGGVQWDGKHVAVGDQAAPFIYQFAIHGTRGTVVGTTHMGSGARNVGQFWIEDQTLIAPNTIPGRGGNGSKALFYNYPAGGKAVKKIAKGVEAANGIVVSLAPK